MSPSEIDSLLSSLKKLPGEFKMLIEKRIELFTLEIAERFAGMVVNAVYRLTGIVFLALGLILFLFAVANFVGDLLGNESLGFVVVSFPILLLGLLFFLRRPRSMVIRTRDKMVHQFMKDLSEQMSQFDDDDNNGLDTGTGSKDNTGVTEKSEKREKNGDGNKAGENEKTGDRGDSGNRGQKSGSTSGRSADSGI